MADCVGLICLLPKLIIFSCFLADVPSYLGVFYFCLKTRNSNIMEEDLRSRRIYLDTNSAIVAMCIYPHKTMFSVP